MGLWDPGWGRDAGWGSRMATWGGGVKVLGSSRMGTWMGRWGPGWGSGLGVGPWGQRRGPGGGMGLWDVVGRPSRGLGAHSPTPSSPPAPPRPGAGAVPQPAADQGLRAAAAGDRQPEPPLRAVLQAGARRAVSGARPHSALCPGDPGASPSPSPSSSPPRGPLYFCMCPHPPLLAPAWAPECVYFVPNASLIVNLFFKKKEEKRIKKKKKKKEQSRARGRRAG